MHDKNKLELLSPKSTDFSMDDDSCSYLPEKRMRMNYKQVDVVSMTFATAVAQRGWRRFGRNFIYPVCFGCTACKSMRIDVNNYKYSKSQRKAINRNEDTKIIIQNQLLHKHT